MPVMASSRPRLSAPSSLSISDPYPTENAHDLLLRQYATQVNRSRAWPRTGELCAGCPSFGAATNDVQDIVVEIADHDPSPPSAIEVERRGDTVVGRKHEAC